jgi:hypothetical protein
LKLLSAVVQDVGDMSPTAVKATGIDLEIIVNFGFVPFRNLQATNWNSQITDESDKRFPERNQL